MRKRREGEGRPSALRNNSVTRCSTVSPIQRLYQIKYASGVGRLAGRRILCNRILVLFGYDKNSCRIGCQGLATCSYVALLEIGIFFKEDNVLLILLLEVWTLGSDYIHPLAGRLLGCKSVYNQFAPTETSEDSSLGDIVIPKWVCFIASCPDHLCTQNRNL